jgi:hypothetical protein
MLYAIKLIFMFDMTTTMYIFHQNLLLGDMTGLWAPCSLELQLGDASEHLLS